MKKILTMLLIMVFLLSGCGTNGNKDENAGTEQPNKDTLVVVPDIATESFDPYTADMDSVISCQIFDRLFQRDKEGNIVPCLAESYEENEDGMGITVKLKKGITFSDGTPFNADAVIYNFNLGLSSYSEGSGIGYIAGAEKLDEYTVLFTKHVPYTDITAILASYMPIVSPEAYKADSEGFATNPVGTGAYLLDSYDETTGYVYLTAREDYFQGIPAIKNIEVQVPLESSVALVALENEEVDLVEKPMSNTDLEIAESEGIVVERSTGWSMKSLFLFGEPFVTDKNLAHAIIYAVNKENAAISNGDANAKIAENLMAERLMGENAGCIDIYEYNPDKAKEFLAKSNYDGETLYIDITEEASKVATSIQADLQAIGLNVEINQLDANTFSDLFGRNEIHMSVLDNGVAALGLEDSFSYFCADGYYEACGLVASTPEMDDLMHQILSTTSKEERTNLLADFMKLFQDNGDLVPLYEPTLTYAHSAKLKGAESIWGATTSFYLWKCSFD